MSNNRCNETAVISLQFSKDYVESLLVLLLETFVAVIAWPFSFHTRRIYSVHCAAHNATILLSYFKYINEQNLFQYLTRKLILLTCRLYNFY